MMSALLELLPSAVGHLPALATVLMQIALFAFGVTLVYKARALFTIQRPSDAKSSMWGLVAIPESERWSLCNAKGEKRTLVGPQVVWVFGGRLVQLSRRTASNSEYLWVQFVDGKTEIVPGPAVVYWDPAIHKDVKVQNAVNLTDYEVLVVYRAEEGGDEKGEEDDEEQKKKTGTKKRTGGDDAAAPRRVVTRSLVHGPCLHVPKNASEWTHEFCWHGSISGDPESAARKRKDALRFKKLRACPDQTYYDVEGVRTKDDALVTVKLMIFFRLQDIDQMLRETHDPIADFVNAVTSDVIDFVAGKSFEEFKQATEQLNDLVVYPQLKTRAKGIGYDVTKVVFRGYGAPTRLQKMHDDAIERRTKLALERETEDQEQVLLDMKLDREADRQKRERQMEKDAKAHERECQRLAFDAKQEEKKREQDAHFEQLRRLQKDLGLSGEQLGAYLLAVEQGPPGKLIQISGGKEGLASNGSSFVHLQDVKG